MWQDWVNAILGVVIIGVALFGGIEMTLAWTLGVLGLIVAALGIWGGSVSMSSESGFSHA